MGALVFIMMDLDRNVFGAFLSEGFKCSDEYFGSAECALFKWEPETVSEGMN